MNKMDSKDLCRGHSQSHRKRESLQNFAKSRRTQKFQSVSSLPTRAKRSFASFRLTERKHIQLEISNRTAKDDSQLWINRWECFFRAPHFCRSRYSVFLTSKFNVQWDVQSLRSIIRNKHWCVWADMTLNLDESLQKCFVNMDRSNQIDRIHWCAQVWGALDYCPYLKSYCLMISEAA